MKQFRVFWIVSVALLAGFSHGTTLYHWDFSTRTNGTMLSQAYSAAQNPSVQFSSYGIGSSLQVSDGSLIVNAEGRAESYPFSNSYADITDLSSGTYWLVCDLAGWDFPSSASIMDLFYNSGATTGDAISAFRISRSASTGKVQFLLICSNGIVQAFGNLPPTTSDSYSVALKLDLESSKVALFYKAGTNEWVGSAEYNAKTTLDCSHVRLQASGFDGTNQVSVSGIRLQDHPPWKEEKLVISGSMHCYPLHLASYLDPVNKSDRPLDWDPRLTQAAADHLKLQRMEEAGIEVCAKTVFYADGTPTTRGLGIFWRALIAAQDLNIRVAPEINMIRSAATYGAADLAAFFQTMIEDYGDDPRWFRYNGKLVVFLWNPFDDNYGSSINYGPDDLQDAWDLLGSELRSKIYVINETSYMTWQSDTYAASHWNDNNYVSDLLSVTDTLFWWNTYPTAEQHQFRTDLLLNSLPDGPVIASTQYEYYRKNTGIITPSGVTTRFRDLWNVGLSVDPDWVYFVYWDDYSENTGFEPSRINRGFYSSLARTTASIWKERPDTLSGESWIGMPLCVMRGYEFNAEVVQLNVVSPYSTVTLALEDQHGQEVYRSSAVTAQDFYSTNGAIKVFSFSVPTADSAFTGIQALVPVVYTNGSQTAIRGLSPIRLLRNHPTSPLYQFYRIDRLRQPSSIQLSYSSVPAGGQTNSVAGSFQVTAGSTNQFRRVELRDLNDNAVAFSGGAFPSISATNDAWYLPLSSPTGSLSATFGFLPGQLHDADAMTYLFVEYEDGSTWAGSPQVIPFTNGTAQSTVFESGPFFLNPTEWIPSSRESMSTSLTCVADWNMGDYNSTNLYNGFPYVPDHGLYGFPLYLGYGPNNRTFFGTTNNYPVPGTGYMSFNLSGDNGQVMRLPDFVLPPGAAAVELEMFPLNTSGEQYLLWHRRGGLAVKLLNGHVVISRGENVNGSTNLMSLTSVQSIAAQQWSTVRVGDDGQRLYIYINGTLDSVSGHGPLTVVEPMSTWTDLILVGGGTDVTKSFHGHIRTLRIKNESSAVPPLSGPFGESFSGTEPDPLYWRTISSANTEVLVTNGVLLLNDWTTSWGVGAAVETWLPYAVTGQPIRISAQIVSEVNSSENGAQVQIGLTNSVYLVYSFNASIQRVKLVVQGQTIWDSTLWPVGSLLQMGQYIGVEFSSAGWDVVKSSDGINWNLLVSSGSNISQGSFAQPCVFDFAEPLTLKMLNAYGGTSGISIALDNFFLNNL